MKKLCSIFVLVLCLVYSINLRAVPCAMGHPYSHYTIRLTVCPVDSVVDSLSVLQAFQQLQHNPAFLKDIALTQREAKKVQFYVPEGGVVLGDINNDQQSDGLILFSVQGRGDGNNWDVHAALLIYKDHSWHYTTQLNCGANATDYILIFNRIDSGKIYGKSFPSGSDDPELSQDIVYRLVESKLRMENNLFQKRPTEAGRRWLIVSGVLSKQRHFLPFKSTLQEIRSFLGKEDSSHISAQQCGHYFDTDNVKYFFFKKGLTFEVNVTNEAVLTELKIADLAFGLKTNMGILDATVTRKDFEQIFAGQYFMIEEADSVNGTQNSFLRIPAGADTDNCWDVYFDVSGKIETVILFIPC